MRHLRLRGCSSHAGPLEPAYTACSLDFADFGGSIAVLDAFEADQLMAWLDAQRPKVFVFIGIVKYELDAAQRLRAACAAWGYDACVGFVNSDHAFVSESGVHSEEDLDNHRSRSVNRRLFEEVWMPKDFFPIRAPGCVTWLRHIPEVATYRGINNFDVGERETYLSVD